jgi:hypothetical protein
LIQFNDCKKRLWHLPPKNGQYKCTHLCP